MCGQAAAGTQLWGDGTSWIRTAWEDSGEVSKGTWGPSNRVSPSQDEWGVPLQKERGACPQIGAQALCGVGK